MQLTSGVSPENLPDDENLSDEVFVLPTSFAQQRMWFLNELEPDSAFYNIPAAVRLEGSLDIQVLQRALDEIVNRHETLRTTLKAQDGQPVQVISPEGSIKIDLIDLSHLTDLRREMETTRLAEEEARRPFDLAKGPLLRVRLLKLGDREHVALLTMHHIISDGWSMGVLIREIATLYAAFSQGLPSPLPELPIQYADFAIWQRDQLKEEGLNKQLAFWMDHLSGDLPVIKLPTDRPRPPVQSFRGATISRRLPFALMEAIKALGRSEDATLYMTLLAAFQVLLYRYTGQEDFTIGSPIANRNRAEVEGLIGLFVNTLVLRADLPADAVDRLSFRTLLRQVRDFTLEAYANQDLPFDTLVEALRPERNLSYNPLFQVMFILQNAASSQNFAMSDLKMSMMDVETGTSTFDLTLMVAEGVEGLETSIEYNTDLFDASTIESMLDHFQTLLEGITANPDEVITRFPLLSEVERHRILVEWNDFDRDYPKLGYTVPQLLAEQAAATPDATAVVWPSPDTGVVESYTYAELHSRANQFARYLREMGIGPNTPVALCLERSLELMVAVLGVIKAGGAYLPIDPTYPADRIAFMLSDAAAPVLVTQQRLLGTLPEHQARVVLIDADWSVIESFPTDEPEPVVRPDDLIYIIYTSGSTGKPKGVQVLQHNLVNAYLAWEEAYDLRSIRSHLQMANFAFDVFTGDMMRALGSGGKLVLCPREYLLAPEALYQLMLDHQIEFAEFVPAVLRTVIQHVKKIGKDLSFMRLLICGSDVWYVEEFRSILKLCGPETRLINSFGLTEVTIDSSYFEDREIDLPPDAVAPIGKPYPNQRLYILDRHMEPLPPLVPGELYVGGLCVTAGYLNRPELNAERFIPDPFSSRPGAKLYKTGDLARFLKDGNVEFLGRMDYQVKIRGFRVEIGEIESTLRQHPDLKDAVVIAASPNKTTGQRLVAYLVTRSGEPLPLEDLRAYLRDKLPDYMVPSAFMFLEKLPLTQNGKIDRKSLPAPDWSRDAIGLAYVAPRNETEQALAEMWGQILGVDQVGVEDNFFELGGHSLLATQVISRIREHFSVDLPLRRLFEEPTIAGLAALVDEALAAGESPSEVDAAAIKTIPPAPRDKPLPLSFAQQRLWFMDQLEPDSPFYNIPEGIRLTGKIDISILERALNEVIRRHEVLRTTFHTVDDQPVQVIAPELTLTIPLTDLSHIPAAQREAEIERLVQEEARKPFSLTKGPLLRARLLRLAEEEHIILLTIHHIVGDDWSTKVLIQEISLLYAAFAEGMPSPLPELPIQYADFAVWQRNYLQGEVLDRYTNYWKQQLAGIPPLLELPTDHPRPAVMSFRGDYLPFRLPTAVANGLRELAKKEGVSLFMLMLAAFNVLLSRYSGQEDIVVGTPIANRNRADIEGLIGFFVNTLALRTDLSGEPTFRELLQRVREVCLSAYTYQDLPFEQVVEITQPDRSLSYNPLFQVMFVLQNAPGSAQELPGLSIQPVESHSGTAKFDLTFFMIEDDENLSGAFEYSTDLFEPETIQRMMTNFAIMLEGILQDPDQVIGRLPLLSERERKLLIEEWNRTGAPFPAERLTHELIAEQAQRTPDAVAVVFQDQSLTYAELDSRANQLAHYLQQHGAGPDIPIGLCLERSIEMLVGILGILKSGSPYVPLDPNYPADRLAFMLDDSAIPVLLTQERLLDRLPQTQALPICLDRDWPEIALQPAAAPECRATPDNLAYIIYTSGSTGRPKGAMIRHSGLVNYLTWTLQAYPLNQGIGTPVHSSISFDLTVTSIYPALLSGKTVFMLPEELGIEALGEFLRDHENLSLIKITPAHLKILGEQVEAERAARITHAFIIGGENLLVDHIDFWQKYAPNTALVNEYGPTETVVGCCVYWAPPGKHKTGVIPIGKPIINTTHYVLDKYLQPVPIGARGELYIGGAGVARGYLNRPDLTGERFLPDPFSPEPGAVMYKSGDLVRWIATGPDDGILECLGRIDFQVKIRGFRVELGEVESALTQHPAVKEAVVWAREENGVNRLIAYVVPESMDTAPKVSELRDFLKASLPDYMIPSAFVLLEALPLTPNGKLDRKALPEPEPYRPELETGYRAPETITERRLAEIWQGVLGIEQVGVDDNFFELGGDSILSLQVVSRARQQGVVISPKLIFENPTIAELAAAADQAAGASGLEGLVQAEQGPVVGEAPLTPVQRWFFDLSIPNPNHWNQSVLISLPVKIEPRQLEAAVLALMEQHDALRGRFITGEDGERRMVYDPPQETAPLLWQDLSTCSSAEIEQQLAAGLDSAQASLDLENGPVFRAAAFWLGESRGSRLLLAAHHLVIDAVSWRIILEDLYALFQQIGSGLPAALPEKTTSFKAWAESQPEMAQHPAVLEQLPFWLEQAALPTAQIPLDDPNGTNREMDAEAVSLTLSIEETQRMLQEAANTYHCDIPTLLATALVQALKDWTGEPRWRIEMEGHGRDAVSGNMDLSRTVGWFTSLYPLALDISGCSSPAEALRSVKDTLARQPEQTLGYGLLKTYHPDPAVRRSLQAAGRPEITLNYLGRLDSPAGDLDESTAIGGLSMAAEPRGSERCPQGQRTCIWEVTGSLAGGQLYLEWGYSRALHRRETVERVVEQFAGCLRALINGEAAAVQKTITAADVEDFGWGQDDLDEIMGALGLNDEAE